MTRETLPIPARKWLVIDGSVPDRDAFVELARAKLGTDRFFEERRWFLKDDQLFRDSTSTFALSNQWSGPDVLPAISQISTEHPELAVSYEPTPSVG